MLNTNTKQRGFTIVELLIVIVVIAILAAISIVAYNGIQNRGKASSAQSLASQVAKKAEAYNTIKSSYPANKAAFNSATDAQEAKLDDPSKLNDTTGTTPFGMPTDESTVSYKKCSTGAMVYWYDATSKFVNIIGIGGAASTPSGSTATPTPCP